MGNGHEGVAGTFGVVNELATYLQLRAKYFPTTTVGETLGSLASAASQQLSLDANQQKVVVVQDKEGHPVMTARPGNQLTVSNDIDLGTVYVFEKGAGVRMEGIQMRAYLPQIKIFVNGAYYDSGPTDSTPIPNTLDALRVESYFPFQLDGRLYDVDNPNGKPITVTSAANVIRQFATFYTLVTGAVAITPMGDGNCDYKLTNTTTGADVTIDFKNTPGNLPAGTYKLEALRGAFRVRYSNAYQDISYNFYDQKGQLLASLAPNGAQLVHAVNNQTGPTWQTPSTAPYASPTGSALLFDGVDDRIETTTRDGDPRAVVNAPATANTFTMEAWVYPTATHNDAVDQTNQYAGFAANHRSAIHVGSAAWYPAGHAAVELSIGTNGVVVYELGSNWYPAVLVWKGAITGWTHVAVTFTNKVPTLFVNGIQVATGTPWTQIDYVHPSVNLGGGTYKGLLDEFRVYDSVKDAQSIAAESRGTVAPANSSLVAYYRLDEGKGILVTDLSRSHYTGVLKGGTPPNTFPSLASLPFLNTYEYDVQGRQTAMTETDAGRTEYFYRNDGKLRFSQNANQRANGYFSYTNYDNIGRPIESGECRPNSPATFFTSIKNDAATLDYEPSSYSSYYDGPLGGQFRYEVVRTYYDNLRGRFSLPNGYSPEFVAGQAAAMAKYSSITPWDAQSEVSHTIYSYDDQGRTTWLVTQQGQLPMRTMEYTYDFSGKVLTACYQKNMPAERLTHYYAYDADQRLQEVRTNLALPTDQATPRDLQAKYVYYLHGPLKRVELGGNLQGIDYFYTVQGWLKSINGETSTADPGQDGLNNSLLFKPDLFGTTLQYFNGDYQASARPVSGFTENTAQNAPRYNGTVRAASWQTTGIAPQGYIYAYDDKGQLTNADYGTVTGAATNLNFLLSGNGQYAEKGIDYDPNGNITNLRRTDGVGWASFAGQYNYQGPNLNTNKLTAVKVPGGTTDLIKYTYDALGQTVAQEEVTGNKYLEYDVAGKVTAVFRDAARQQPVARYTYDEFGHRIKEQRYPNAAVPTQVETLYYVYDAGGNELATYATDAATGQITLTEQPVYGAARLGSYRRATGNQTADQLYEIHDQLGNTRVVFHRPQEASYSANMEGGPTEEQEFSFPPAIRSGVYKRSGANAAWLRDTYRNGPKKTLQVQRGDKVKMSVYVGYPTDGGVLARAAVVGGVVAGSVGVQAVAGKEGEVKPSKTQQLLSRLSLGVAVPLLARTVGTQATLPNAQLYYVLRDKNGGFLTNGRVLVPSSAEGKWTELVIDYDVVDKQASSLEVGVVSNDGVSVYFDDFSIKHTSGMLLEENHFYAYGQRNDPLSWTSQYLQNFRRGYQGQFSKFDKETGYNSFDLRMYDARTGRWMSKDPYGQYDSPYLGMGNNPANSYDPNGGYSHFGATWRHAAAVFLGNDVSEIYQVDEEWGFIDLDNNKHDFGVKYDVAEVYRGESFWDKISFKGGGYQYYSSESYANGPVWHVRNGVASGAIIDPHKNLITFENLPTGKPTFGLPGSNTVATAIKGAVDNYKTGLDALGKAQLTDPYISLLESSVYDTVSARAQLIEANRDANGNYPTFRIDSVNRNGKFMHLIKTPINWNGKKIGSPSFYE
ncbi:RHS repeat-associated core domain-containing protein [Hymenobacter sublimis]|uniref:LamG-like jellyroll fold domain-containing protein n=1 Tax=Hymenobacter sublimis TaxID=2933777 RepID=A0ABY4JE59_9BACT|nr:RHS repeat-associated core domain-containing protein [Hymenobacter sublimis]UPL50202.1 hypothetical protein MWH26_04660 [Hymenobacter sublimis]